MQRLRFVVLAAFFVAVFFAAPVLHEVAHYAVGYLSGSSCRLVVGVVGYSVLQTTCEGTPSCLFYLAPHALFVLIAAAAYYALQRWRSELLRRELAPFVIAVLVVFAGQEVLTLFFALSGINSPSSFAASDYGAITRCALGG